MTEWADHRGVDGTGIKVGIISDSFDTSGDGSMATDIASGDLPADTTILQDYTGTVTAPSTDEGRGMAQLVHDLAPGASIEFATGYYGQAGFANNIIALANAGAKVIVDDLSYFAEPAFQDGIIAQAIDQVAAQGVSYFTSVANDGNKGYEAAFNAGANPEVVAYNNNIYTLDDFSLVSPRSRSSFHQARSSSWNGTNLRNRSIPLMVQLVI